MLGNLEVFSFPGCGAGPGPNGSTNGCRINCLFPGGDPKNWLMQGWLIFKPVYRAKGCGFDCPSKHGRRAGGGKMVVPTYDRPRVMSNTALRCHRGVGFRWGMRGDRR